MNTPLQSDVTVRWPVVNECGYDNPLTEIASPLFKRSSYKTWFVNFALKLLSHFLTTLVFH